MTRQQGTAQALFQGATGASVLCAGLWAGLAWGDDGVVRLLVAGGVALVLAVVLIAACVRPARR